MSEERPVVYHDRWEAREEKEGIGLVLRGGSHLDLLLWEERIAGN